MNFNVQVFNWIRQINGVQEAERRDLRRTPGIKRIGSVQEKCGKEKREEGLGSKNDSREEKSKRAV